MSKYWSKLLCLKGVGHFERKFQGNFLGYSLRDPTFSRFDTIPACGTHTDGHAMMAITRAELASSARVKMANVESTVYGSLGILAF